MMCRSFESRRAGVILPMLAFTLIVLMAFVAMAIDLGMIAVGRSQAQNAADAAAMAGNRAMTWGSSGQDVSQVADKACDAANAPSNAILGTTLADANTTVEIGYYTWNATGNTFPVPPFAAPYSNSNPDPGFVTVTRDNNSIANARASNTPPENYSMVRATVNFSIARRFSAIWSSAPFNIQTQATAIHRPRDVAVVVDFSGSMMQASRLGLNSSDGMATLRRASNDPNSIYPTLGAYSATSSAALQGTTTTSFDYNGATYAPSNHSITFDGRNPIADDFYSDTTGAGTKAFASETPDTANYNYATTNPGDKYLFLNGATTGSTFAKTINDLSVSRANWHTNGYNQFYASGTTFKGFTQGPGYYGKTFFIWPPDPRTPSGTDATDSAYVAGDWRKRFFESTLTNNKVDNRNFWTEGTGDGNGIWRAPASGRYQINYAAILRWLKATPAFPSQVKSGRILYYDAIPDPAASPYSSDADLNAKFRVFQMPPVPTDRVFTTTISSGDLALSGNPAAYSTSFTYQQAHNQAFWKDYIDYVLGVHQWSDGVYYNLGTDWGTADGSSGAMGYGEDFVWGSGSVRISAPPSGAISDTSWYMDPADSPRRPKLHFWFGGLTFSDFLCNYAMMFEARSSYLTPQPAPHDVQQSAVKFNWLPGTCSEAPMANCKFGIRAALLNIKDSHPNDWVTLIGFNHPRMAAASGVSSIHPRAGRMNRVLTPLGTRYDRMVDALFFPLHTLDSTSTLVRPFDSDRNREVPRAYGGTCYAMGLMLAYNQFSSNANLRTFNTGGASAGVLNGDAGGLGRDGARKLVIFETDGQPTARLSTPDSGSGTGNTSAGLSFDAGASKYYYGVRTNNGSTGTASDSIAGDAVRTDGTATDNQIMRVAGQICASTTASSSTPTTYTNSGVGGSSGDPLYNVNFIRPGYSTSRNPVLLHCIAFGPIFASGSSSAQKDPGLRVMQQMELIGKVQTGGVSGTVDARLPSYKKISGTNAVNDLQTAFTIILQGGVQVSLIQ